MNLAALSHAISHLLIRQKQLFRGRLSRNFLVGLLVLSSVLACRFSPPFARATPSPSSTRAEPSVAQDLAYVPEAHPMQTLDIYAPPEIDAAPHAVMIYVHGGGWATGDKRRVNAKDDYFTQSGWIFISVNYRLHPDATWQEMAQDVAQAVAWVYAHIAEYGGDPEKIFLMGHSAGAHLVSLVATDERYLEAAGLNLGVLRGVLSLDTRAYDIPSLAQSSGGLPEVYTRIFGNDPQVWQAASPIYHLQPGKHIPPFVIAWSKGTRIALEAQEREQFARDFADALRSIGVEALLVDGSDQTHGEINQQFGFADDAVTLQAMRFFSSLVELDT